MHSNSEQKLTSVLKRDKYLRILYIAEEGAAILFCCTFCVNKRERESIILLDTALRIMYNKAVR